MGGRGKEQQKGIDYEARLAKLLGADLVPGSGNQWYAKGDLSGRAILWFLKHTGKDFFRVSKAVLHEAITASNKTGAIPAWAIDIAGEDFIMMRANDFIMLHEEDFEVAKPTKVARKRKRAGTLLILRGDNDVSDN